MEYQILLYYSYVAISDPVALAMRQRTLCQELGLKGRIIIASEGINGTIEGSIEATEQYMDRSLAEPSFVAVAYKKSKGTGTAFPKLSVKARSEIVSAHLDEEDVYPTIVTGAHLQPKELHSWINSDKQFYIVDMRNDYEHAVGHFQNSILPNIQNFRQLPEVLPSIEHLKGKTVLTVCTGGVRCEKASGYLIENGFADVYQLDGGIVSYMEQYPNEDFLGSLYVFDSRITMSFNSDVFPRKIIGECERCQATSEIYINCANVECNRHFICCQMCTKTGAAMYCGSLCITVKADTLAGF